MNTRREPDAGVEPAPPAETRPTGIDVVGDAPWGTHFCQFYATRDDLVEILVPYFKAGLEHDEFCMWVTSPPLGVREAWDALAKAVPDLDSHRRRGRIEILPHTDWYLLGGTFDQDRVLKGWVDKLEAALARGCAGLRLSGNTFWLEKSDWKGFAEYEAAVDAVLGRYRMLALCTYSLERCGAAEVADVIRNHQFALIKRDGAWELLESGDRRRMQEAHARASESEERYRLLFDNLSEGLAVHEMLYDAQGRPYDYRFLEVNPAFERLTGLRREHAVGRTLLEVLPGSDRFWIERYAEVVATGIPARFERQEKTLGRHYEVFAFRPRPGQFAALFFDVTERRRAEEGREQLIARLEQLQAATEAARREAENGKQLLEAVMNALPVGVAITDARGASLRNNDAFDRIWRGPRPLPQSAADYAAYQAFWPDTGEAVATEQWASLQAVEKGEPVVGQLLEIQRFDGSRAFVLNSAAPVRDADGSIVGSAVAIQDVTELRRFEDELRQKQEALNEAQRIARVGSWYWDARTDANTGSEELLRIFGQPCPPFREQKGTMYPPESWERLNAAVQKAVATGVGYELDLEGLRGDGSTIGITTHGEVVRDASGVVIGMRGTVQDISERKRIERLYAVLSRANEAIVRIHDEQALYEEVCRIVAEAGQFPLVWIGLVAEGEVSPAASSGPAVDYLAHIAVKVAGDLGAGPTGTSIREDRPVVNDDFDSNAATAPWREPALRHGFRASASFPLHRGSEVIGALTLYATRPGAFDAEQLRLLGALSADLSYALAAMRQESLRKAAEQALRASEQSLREVDQRKDEFMAVLSHELRNPLAPIRNSLYVLDRAAPGGAQAERAKAVIGRQVEQLSRLVDDLLDVTRIARSKIQLHRETVDLNRLAERALDDHRSVFEDNEVEVALELAGAPPLVHGDAARLTQVVGNLLQNAAKFTPRGGRVGLTIAADPSDSKAIIRVTDTGVGMAPETLARMFEPFMQADKTLDRSKGGLGLGLALVKGLVELHGGEISARSAGLGRGAEFVVRLPLAPTPPRRSEAPPARERQSRRRVLIIEDSVDAADSLCAALTLGQHEVAVAYDGTEGLAKAREFRPEVVLCDIGLPGMDGFAVARAFKADEALKHVFLVALSGYALPEDVQRASEAGFARHLAKPPNLEALRLLLADVPKAGAQAADTSASRQAPR
jgi:PAS domain S-box-containing protein